MCAAGLHAVGLARLGRATVLGQEWVADGGGVNRTRTDRKWGEGLSFVWDQQTLRGTSGNSGGQALGKVVIVYECEGTWVGVCGRVTLSSSPSLLYLSLLGSWVTPSVLICVWGVCSVGRQSGSAAGTGSFLFTKVGSLLPGLGPCCLFCVHTRGPSW